MSLPTFFAPSATLRSGASIVIDGEEYHHLRVRRLRVGDNVRVIDGKGTELLGVLQRVGPREAEIRIVQALSGQSESPLDITLAVAPVREERMTYALEKATELGASRIVVFGSKRGRAYDQQRRLERWKRIVLEATKQCQRSRVPTLVSVPSVEALLPLERPPLGLVLHPSATMPDGEKDLPWSVPKPAGVTVVIGPEGGFAPDELRVLETGGFLPVRLGPRVLRTETAVVAALTLVQFLWGDLRQTATAEVV